MKPSAQRSIFSFPKVIEAPAAVKDFLLSLTGQKITQIARHFDYLQIAFENGDILNIYNQVVGPIEGIQPGEFVSRIDLHEHRIVFTFSNQNNLTVSLDDRAFTGPEIFELNKGSGEIVVLRAEDI